MEKVVRLIVLPAFILAITFISLGGKKEEPPYLKGGAWLLGRDFYNNYVDSDFCEGLYDCGEKMCELNRNRSVTNMLIIPREYEEECNPTEECFIYGLGMIIMFAAAIIITISFGIIILLVQNRTVVVISALFVLVAHTVVRTISIINSFITYRLPEYDSGYCWEYETTAKLIFSSYLLVDLAAYFFYVADLISGKNDIAM